MTKQPGLLAADEPEVGTRAAAQPEKKWQRAKTRAGKRGITMWVDEDVFEQAKVLAIKKKMKIGEVALAGLYDFLKANRGILESMYRPEDIKRQG
jgi:hypothetical protein